MVELLVAILALLVVAAVVASALGWRRPGEQTTVAGPGMGLVLALLGLLMGGWAAVLLFAPADAPARATRLVPYVTIAALVALAAVFVVRWRAGWGRGARPR